MAIPTTAKKTGAKVDIPVQGMTCAACQVSVQKALQRQPGVVDASVNLMMKNAAVTYDPAKTPFASIREALDDAGYTASPVERAERLA